MRAGSLIAGRYRLEAPLGAGSMGQVWRARDERLQRAVAIKLVDLTSATGLVSSQQVQREVQAAAQLNHHAIVTMFDGGTDGDIAFLVMELLDGQSLAERLSRGPLPVSEALRVASEVGRALEATHLIGVVHRDIKPGNVMLAGNGRVKVLDYGIAQLVTDPTEAPGTPVIGTAAYMSPEQAAGRSAGPSTDVYALGCLIVAMLAGRPPFVGASSLDVAQQQVNSTPPRLASLRPDAPADLDALVAEMLDKNPDRRPRAADVVRRLDAIASARTSGPAATAVLGGAAATSVLPAASPAGAPAARPVPVPPPPPPTSVLGDRGYTGPDRGVPAAQGRLATASKKWGYGRIARTIVAAMVVLVGIGVIWQGWPRVVALLPKPATASPSTTKTKTTPPRTTTTSKPATSTTRPTVTLPSITLPTLPDPSQVAVEAALAGVASVLDSWSPSNSEQEAAKADLVDSWSSTSRAIVAGDDPAGALASFRSDMDDKRSNGSLPAGIYAGLVVAVGAVDALV